MKLRYELTIDDLIAFQLFHFKNSPAMQKSLRTGMVTSALVPLFVALALGFKSRVPLVALFIGCVGAVVAALWVRAKFPRAIETQTRRSIEGSGNKALFGTHELELEDDWLVERTEVSANRLAWRAVDKIVETDDYVFIYVSAVSAHVLPKRNLSPNDLQPFLNRARQLLAAAQG